MIRVLDEARSADFDRPALGLESAGRRDVDNLAAMGLRNADADFERELIVNAGRTEPQALGSGCGRFAAAGPNPNKPTENSEKTGRKNMSVSQRTDSEDVGTDAGSLKLLTRMIRVLYPHARFPDGPYERTADAVVAAANKTPGQALVLDAGLRELEANAFADLDDAAATAHLEAIEGSPFFALVRSTAVVALYDDHEVWRLLGYEGPSFDAGGYIERGFGDLDWLPEPRITEL